MLTANCGAPAAAAESGSQKVQHFFGGFKHESEIIQLTKVVTTENSTDLERGAAPRSIADEFSVVTTLVQKLQWCENTAFHFHAAPFGIQTPCRNFSGNLKLRPKLRLSAT